MLLLQLPRLCSNTTMVTQKRSKAKQKIKGRNSIDKKCVVCACNLRILYARHVFHAIIIRTYLNCATNEKKNALIPRTTVDELKESMPANTLNAARCCIQNTESTSTCSFVHDHDSSGKFSACSDNNFFLLGFGFYFVTLKEQLPSSGFGLTPLKPNKNNKSFK